MNRWRNLSLRSRLVALVVAAVAIVVATNGAYLMISQKRVLREQMEATQSLLREELGRKGVAVASNVALASGRALAVRDFLFVAQIIQAVQESDAQFVYGCVLNEEGRALVHTNPELAGQIIDSHQGTQMPPGKSFLVRDASYHGVPIMEVTTQLVVAGKLMGVVQLGLSLQKLDAELASCAARTAEQIEGSVLRSGVLAIVLLAFGILLAVASANTLLQPLSKLMQAVQKIQEGDLQHTVAVTGSPEFTRLGRAFNEMTLAVRQRETELQSALAVADEASRLKTEFLANISHELRTPLNAIINVPGALLEDYKTILLWTCPNCAAKFEPDSHSTYQPDASETCPDCGTAMALEHHVTCIGDMAEHQRLNQRALASGQHLLRVVNDLLDFSRLQAGKLELWPEDTKVSSFIGDIRDTMQSLADAKRISLTIDAGAAENLVLFVDRVKVGQVFINLLGNAIKFTPERGRVSLSLVSGADKSDDTIHFVVKDSGIGIPEDKLSMIFEAFRQVDGSHTRTYGGSGLGLAITAQIVKLHGGRVWAESVVGQGSALHVVLLKRVPRRVDDPEEVVQESPTVLAEGTQRRVLIIDDDESYLSVSKSVLTRAGMLVEISSNNGAAFETISETQPDLVIVDVMMPHISGLDVLRRLKNDAQTKHIPVLVSTGYHANKHIVTQLGGLWLPKPWTQGDLLECLIRYGIIRAPEPEAAASSHDVGNT